MGAGTAARHLPPATETPPAARVRFSTLLGPGPSTTRRGRSADQHLLATVSHELRNPLASLRLSLEMLVQEFDTLEPEQRLHLVRRAQRNVRWLQTLAETLCSPASAAAGPSALRREPTDVLACIQDACQLVQGLLDQRGQRVRVVCSAQPPIAWAEPARVIQIVANLVGNASRYSVDGDQIDVHLSAIGRQLLVRVTDHGPGIAPADQQRIFGRYVQGQAAGAGGSGLGLHIVRSLVEQHGGRVGVDSVVGCGSTFWFTLPGSDSAQ